MTAAKKNDEVAVHYKGTLSDGREFDRSDPGNPLTFTVGAGQVIPGFEQAVEGMNVGESKTVTLAAKDAYGEHRPDLVMDVGRDQVPEHIKVEVGQHLQMEDNQGQKIPVTVTAVTDEKVTLDANHPMAGKDLTFDIELVKIGQ